jgi:hypothetical protein
MASTVGKARGEPKGNAIIITKQAPGVAPDPLYSANREEMAEMDVKLPSRARKILNRHSNASDVIYNDLLSILGIEELVSRFAKVRLSVLVILDRALRAMTAATYSRHRASEGKRSP